ncbi:hypothetical protein EEL35_09730 [Muribaculaceae bacterium Isolate-042 (Harlan)]|uniref:two-component regulator propeller domain-containing protein n=1 Tax=Muribaculum intestinale TaxID=1796646 RepID=UPI000F492018|nr:two-component regulator propeller domain-containing protein [Muribaculum intestinale]ROS80131.1 hypothetical protein EEL35_09730 [Muribaculaceae bacterium Isolate-042 (Harlan)]
MKLRAVISFLAIIFSVVGVCTEIVRHHFGVADGLSNERVRHIMQDSNGYIWIATWSGVDRFDGYSFINFRTYADDSVRLDHCIIDSDVFRGRVLTVSMKSGIFAGRYGISATSNRRPEQCARGAYNYRPWPD